MSAEDTPDLPIVVVMVKVHLSVLSIRLGCLGFDTAYGATPDLLIKQSFILFNIKTAVAFSKPAPLECFISWGLAVDAHSFTVAWGAAPVTIGFSFIVFMATTF